MVAQSGKIVADLVAKNHPNPGFYSGYRPKWAARR
jgi:hypothetical protein